MNKKHTEACSKAWTEILTGAMLFYDGEKYWLIGAKNRVVNMQVAQWKLVPNMTEVKLPTMRVERLWRYV